MVSGKLAVRLRIVSNNTTWDDMRERLESAEPFQRAALEQLQRSSGDTGGRCRSRGVAEVWGR